MDGPATAAPFDSSPVAANLKQYLQDVECELIGKALAETGGVVAQAARLLKMQRTTLLEKIHKLKIDKF
jgi:sigma-54 specific flagellar transcriptional regulator A